MGLNNNTPDKLAEAKCYLRSRNIYAVEQGNAFFYQRADGHTPAACFVARIRRDLADIRNQLGMEVK